MTKEFNGELIIKICDFDLSKSNLDKDAVAIDWAIQSRLTGTNGYVS